MVRLERAMYEKLVNNNLFSRARHISKPRYYKARPGSDRTFFWPMGGTFYKLFTNAMENWYAFQYRFDLAWFKVRAYALVDFDTFQESDWRRGTLNEHMHRENVHPYYFFQRQMARQRYHKIEKYVAGVEMPDEVIDEVYGTAEIDKQDYRHCYQLLERQYVREMMPNTYMWRAVRWAVLDITIIYNLLNRDMWNRLFYNEMSHVQELDDLEADIDQTRKEAKILTDFSKPDNRSNFKNHLEQQIQKYPGYYTPEGVPFDYESFFEAVVSYQKGEAPKDAAMKQQYHRILKMFGFNRSHDTLFKSQNNEWLHNDAAEEDIQEVTNTVGLKMPERLSSPKYRAWMA